MLCRADDGKTIECADIYRIELIGFDM